MRRRHGRSEAKAKKAINPKDEEPARMAGKKESKGEEEVKRHRK